MRHFHTPGVSVAVIKDFKFHWAKGYGVADEKTGHFVQIDTLCSRGTFPTLTSRVTGPSRRAHCSVTPRVPMMALDSLATTRERLCPAWYKF